MGTSGIGSIRRMPAFAGMTAGIAVSKDKCTNIPDVQASGF
ncbi:hypothetical protein ACCUM_1263 [Candidatus Accumulibacter phosphatis]|uniref:Uncharacterized protein n=1 Tax=Candidatus Accumulibacter phosphatis TaxID=327160 RepID=A0A5S4EJH6_9PROT|nr:hypothetical protein ACCUM_1263 [Candidatus Accumulibacter phosphatis]